MREGEGGSYERAEEELEDLEAEIEFENDATWDEMNPSEQRQAIVDHFFNGKNWTQKGRNTQDSAEELRRGINAIRGNEQVEEGTARFDIIHKGGREYHIVRDTKTGRIRQWVRE